MSTVKMMFAPTEVQLELYRKNTLSLAKQYLSQYTESVEFELEGSDEDLAEEMFDLTNNPSRQQERIEKYGNGKSLSVGDLVSVDERIYLCDSFGWVLIK